ncbi:MAG: HAMP domain-containing sensor histidine kinase [Eubacteriales bacterium]
MKFNLSSIKFRLWLYLTIFIVFVMAAIWMLQTVFLEPYYEFVRTSDLKSAGAEIAKAYGENDFKTYAEEVSYKDNIVINIFDLQGNSVYEANSFGIRGPFGQAPGNTDVPKQVKEGQQTFQKEFFANSVAALNKQDNKEILLKFSDSKFNDPKFDSSVLLYVTKVADGYLFVSTEIRPIDATAKIIESQLMIITIIVFILAALMSILIAISISRPLSKITLASRELANKRFPDDCKGGSYAETRELAETLRKTAADLNKAENLRKEFIGNISHDLRTPMTMIKAYAEALRDLPDETQERRNSDLSIIIHESDRLAEMIKDLLELSKLEAGINNTEFMEFSITDLVKEVLGSYNLYKNRDNYNLLFDYKDNIVVVSDKKKLEQVLHNLIFNGIIHTGKDLTVTVRQISSNDRIRIEVLDSGDGIPDDKIDSIWERYFKIEQNTGRTSEGSGLGLAIVKSALESIKSDFGVYNSENGGAVFWFELNQKNN